MLQQYFSLKSCNTQSVTLYANTALTHSRQEDPHRKGVPGPLPTVNAVLAERFINWVLHVFKEHIAVAPGVSGYVM